MRNDLGATVRLDFPDDRTTEGYADAPSRHDLILITDLSAEFGLSLRTLRYYEERGLLKPARKGNIRVYTSLDRRKLAAIVQLRSVGFGVDEIPDALSVDENGSAVVAHFSVGALYEKLEENMQLREAASLAIDRLNAWLGLSKDSKY
jgi:DNA-binding transcriptional MerR regulator